MLKNLYKGKKVLIFGLGLNDGGLGMTEFFVKQGAIVTVTDGKTEEQLRPTLEKLAKYKRKITYHLGGQIKSDFSSSDIIIQNPGVRPDNEYIKYARELKKTIEMEMSLFCKLAPCKIVGITGTRGKSTTTTLVYRFLKKKYGDKVVLAGNIGKSAIRELPKLTKDHLVVLELSSFQLYTMGLAKVSPDVSLITNIYPDHLNWHLNMQDYINAKSNIVKFQQGRSFAVINADNSYVSDMTAVIRGQTVRYSLVDPSTDYFLDKDLNIYEHGKFLLNIQTATLKGSHNYYNILAAIALSRIFKVSVTDLLSVLKAFKGVKGRQQFLTTINGVRFYNDTTATSVEAVLAMLERFGDEYPKKIIMISGGVDKGLDYSIIKKKVEKYVKGVVLLDGTASDKIIATLDPAKLAIKGKFLVLKEAVASALKSAVRGDMVILCPGAASFNMFKNEFDRGKQFDEVVAELKEHEKRQ